MGTMGERLVRRTEFRKESVKYSAFAGLKDDISNWSSLVKSELVFGLE
jgi:hypothetical protein